MFWGIFVVVDVLLACWFVFLPLSVICCGILSSIAHFWGGSLVGIGLIETGGDVVEEDGLCG